MSNQYSNAVHWGIFALPIAGALALGGTLLHGAVFDPTRDVQGFVQSATTSGFALGWTMVLLSEVAAVLGSVALYGALTRAHSNIAALAGMALYIVGSGLFLSLVGFMAFAAPVAAGLYMQGDSKVLDVIKAGFFAGPVLGVLYPSGLVGTLGSILLGVAIWRSANLPKWAALLFALTVPLSSFGSPISIVLDLLGAMCLLLAGAWIAVSVWRDAWVVVSKSEQILI